MRFCVLFFFISVLFGCSAEKRITKQGKAYITTLASDDFHGRGYTHDGLKIAEDFLANEFNQIGLSPVYPKYRQAVSYPINVLSSVQLKLNDSSWTFGKDYLINPTAENEIIKQETFKIDNSLLDRSIVGDKAIFKLFALNKGKIPVLDYRNVADSTKNTLNGISNYIDQQKTLYDFPALIQIKDKLTHSLADKHDNFTIIQTIHNVDEDDMLDVTVNSTWKKEFKTHNIVGKIAGTKGDSTIIITAHYDHLGQVNQTVFSGANDNASGTSMLLTLANYFIKHPIEEDIYFYALTGEEAGLKGAIVAADNLPIPSEKIKFLINLDIVGTGGDGIQVVNSLIFKEQFTLLNDINNSENYLKQIKPRGESCNSDHCPFYRKGIPSFFIYTLGGISAYHDPFDKAETLPLTAYYNLFLLLTQFIEQL